MTTWTTNKLSLAIPVEHRDLGNKAADLFDPNTEGFLTFPEPNAYAVPDGFDPETDTLDTTPTHCLIRTQLVTEFVPMLSLPYRTADVWEPVLAQMAEERGKEMLTRAEIELLCDVLLFGAECDNLVRIEP
jgi:hypothetical protein